MINYKTAINKRFKDALIIYPLILLVAILPFITSLFCGWVTSLFGVILNEGSPPDIRVFGVHLEIVGNILYAGGNMVWLSILTVPFAAIALIAYTVYLIYTIVKIRRSHNFG